MEIGVALFWFHSSFCLISLNFVCFIVLDVTLKCIGKAKITTKNLRFTFVVSNDWIIHSCFTDVLGLLSQLNNLYLRENVCAIICYNKNRLGKCVFYLYSIYFYAALNKIYPV